MTNETVCERECTSCKQLLSLDYFAKSSKGRYGRRSKCKQCVKTVYAESRRKTNEKRKDAISTYNKQYKAQNREALAEYDRNYRSKRKEVISAYNKRYYRENKERLLAYSAKRFKTYYPKNKGKFILRNHKRRSLMQNLPSDLDMEFINQLKERFGNRCPISGSTEISIDHFVAINTGRGGNVKTNVVPMDLTLNKSKKDRNPFEWARELTEEQRIGFYEVVCYLSEQNGMSTKDYIDYVNSCYE